MASPHERAWSEGHKAERTPSPRNRVPMEAAPCSSIGRQAGWAAGQAANKSDTAPCSRDDEIRNEEGATAIEYGLIAALIAVAAIGAMQGIGNKLNTTFNNVSNSLR